MHTLHETAHETRAESFYGLTERPFALAPMLASAWVMAWLPLTSLPAPTVKWSLL